MEETREGLMDGSYARLRHLVVPQPITGTTGQRRTSWFQWQALIFPVRKDRLNVTKIVTVRYSDLYNQNPGDTARLAD